VFSPYYVQSRARGHGDPDDHCALNVALYGRGVRRWTLTERVKASLQQGRTALQIGPSAVAWTGSALNFAIDERAVPIPRAVRGTVRVEPVSMCDRVFALDPGERHHWRPAAPVARVEVSMREPAVRWSGTGYLDLNWGEEPLESRFEDWQWSCARLKSGAAVLYDVSLRDGNRRSLALRFNSHGDAEPITRPPTASLWPTAWGVPRSTASEAAEPRVRRTLENGPFYARSVVTARLCGEDVTAMHESLSLRRFSRPWVQRLLPYRMPREAG